MTGRTPDSQQPIFNLNAYSPAEIQDSVETVGVKKATLPLLPSFMLSVMAGGSIGLGALYYTIVASDADLSFATTRVVGGLVFSPMRPPFISRDGTEYGGGARAGSGC